MPTLVDATEGVNSPTLYDRQAWLKLLVALDEAHRLPTEPLPAELIGGLLVLPPTGLNLPCHFTLKDHRKYSQGEVYIRLEQKPVSPAPAITAADYYRLCDSALRIAASIQEDCNLTRGCFHPYDIEPIEQPFEPVGPKEKGLAPSLFHQLQRRHHHICRAAVLNLPQSVEVFLLPGKASQSRFYVISNSGRVDCSRMTGSLQPL